MIYLGNGMYSDSSLSHGGPWKNHKYIKKIGEGKLTRYFYTLEELKAYLHAVASRMQQTGEAPRRNTSRYNLTFINHNNQAVSFRHCQ